MNKIRRLFKNIIQKVVDEVHGKKIDIIATVNYIITLAAVILFSIEIFLILKQPIIKHIYNNWIFAFLLFIPLITFYITLAGDFYKTPSRRIEQFIFCILGISIIALRYFIQVSNTSFIAMLGGIKNIDVIPNSLIIGNLKLITFLIPIAIVVPLTFLTIKIVFNEEVKKDLIQYEVDWLLPNIHKANDTTIDIEICKDMISGEPCIIPEKIAYEHLWVQGGTGSGKTATFIRPYLEQLFRIKGYLREEVKRALFECLNKNLAYLTAPVSKEWVLNNFDPTYIQPISEKEAEFAKKMKKYIVGKRTDGKYIYKGLGVTVVSPDGELAKDTINIANHFGVKVHKIDPTMDEINKGIIAKFNPLKGGSPEKVGDIVSSILVSMDQTDSSKANPYFTNASVRAIRNIVILLKVMYPKLNGYDPTLTDVLNILNNFNLAVELVEAMKQYEDFKKRWSSIISYFEASFYPPDVDGNNKPLPNSTRGSQRKKTQEAISGIINQLDNFLGREEIRYILCDNKDSITLSEVLEKGECIAISTRQNNLGARLGKAFALFFLLSLQTDVLSRYSENENPEIPHYVIIDEFPFYVNEQTETFFTFARKYKCSVTIAIQNMGQLKKVNDEFGETIFTNTTTKILLPKSNVEDRKYWAEYFGVSEQFELQTGVSQNSILSSNAKSTQSIKGSITSKNNVSEQEISELNFKETFYSYVDKKGRQRIGKGITDFLDLKSVEKIDNIEYNFSKYNTEIPEQSNIQEIAFENEYIETNIEDTINNIDIIFEDDLENIDNIEKTYNNEVEQEVSDNYGEYNSNSTVDEGKTELEIGLEETTLQSNNSYEQENDLENAALIIDLVPLEQYKLEGSSNDGH